MGDAQRAYDHRLATVQPDERADARSRLSPLRLGRQPRGLDLGGARGPVGREIYLRELRQGLRMEGAAGWLSPFLRPRRPCTTPVPAQHLGDGTSVLPLW